MKRRENPGEIWLRKIQKDKFAQKKKVFEHQNRNHHVQYTSIDSRYDDKC